MDICDVILDDHHQQRKLFALLDSVPRDDVPALTAVWDRLGTLLEVHAQAEEELFYPHLLEVGQGEGGADDAADETEDAIGDHNDIRDGVRATREHPVGSREWWDGVFAARKANDEHMGEEEREGLADFREHAPVQLRHDLAVAFAVYECAHADGHGLSLDDKDPDQYVAEHEPPH